MKAKLTKTSDSDFENKIDVETIEDVLAYHNKLVIRRAEGWDKSDGQESRIGIRMTIAEAKAIIATTKSYSLKRDLQKFIKRKEREQNDKSHKAGYFTNIRHHTTKRQTIRTTERQSSS